MKKHWLLSLAGVALVFARPPTATADMSLPPGTSLSSSQYSSSLPAWATGTPLASFTSLFVGDFEGRITSRVFDEGVTYQVKAPVANTFSFTSGSLLAEPPPFLSLVFADTNWAGIVITDAGADLAHNNAPSSLSRASSGGIMIEDIAGDALKTGESSAIIFFAADFSSGHKKSLVRITGSDGQGADALAFVPKNSSVSVVPTPDAGTLACLGISLILKYRRR
jgi:hypothetical protein